MVQTADGIIYGAGNGGIGPNVSEGGARLFAFEPASKHLEDIGPIYDPRLGMATVKVHMLVDAGNGTLFAGENDNVVRSSYLWECKVGH